MFRRRVTIVLVLMFVVMGLLLARLLGLQALDGEDCRQDLQNSFERHRFLPAKRGTIFDNSGRTVLATDESCFTFCLDYRLMVGDKKWLAQQALAIRRSQRVSREESVKICQQRVEQTLQLAARACGSPQARDAAIAEIVAKVQKLQKAVNDTPREAQQAHPLVTNLDETQANALRVAIEDGTLGASIQPANRRWYPQGDIACHIVGVTGPISAEQLASKNARYESEAWVSQEQDRYGLNDSLGKFGVEKLCEDRLRGRRGYIRTNRNQPQPEIVQPQHGDDVLLTLDINLQRRLTRKFTETYPGRNGSIVVLNVADSSILAMVSIPTYDLNRYRADYRQLLTADWGPGVTDEQDINQLPPNLSGRGSYPMMNRCIAKWYAPGSTVKPLAAVAALQDGVIHTGTSFVCNGQLLPNDSSKLKCTHVHGTMTLSEAIQHSCNVYFYHTGIRLQRHRRDSLIDWFHRFGLARSSGIGLSDEVRGVIKIQDRLDEAQVAIGQGRTGVSPLQVAGSMATLARGGLHLGPKLVRDDRTAPARDLELRSDYVQLVHRAMRDVTAAPGGTAYRSFQGSGLDFEVCAKSGTAQTPPDYWENSPKGAEKLLLRKGHMAWLAGFAPYRNPQVAFAVVVEFVDYDRDGGGATIASPLAIDALKACEELGYIKE